MNLRALAALCGLGLALLPSAGAAPSPETSSLRYQWKPGQTLRYLIQCDPYFTNPARAIETTDPNAPYRPPIVERLTEQVVSVGTDGAATLRLTLASEPGFEDAANPSVTQTVTVTPTGQVVSGVSDSLLPELLSAIFRLPDAPVPMRGTVAVITQDGMPNVTHSTSPSQDGVLLQTTRSRRSERVVFDIRAGSLLRRASTVTGSLSLVIMRPAGRSSDDFGHLVPNLPISQTLTIERKDDLMPTSAPSHALTARQSKN